MQKIIDMMSDDVLSDAVLVLLQTEDHPGDEAIIEMILVERPDWTRDWAVDLLDKIERAMVTK